MGPECFSLQSFDLHIATSKLKKPKVHLIIKKLFLTENECKKRCGCLTFIFCQKHFFMTGFAILMWQYNYNHNLFIFSYPDVCWIFAQYFAT